MRPVHRLPEKNSLKERFFFREHKARLLPVAYVVSTDVWIVDLCNAFDDLTEAEKTAELLPIRVQQLYVLIRLGKSEDAAKLASQLSPNESARVCSFQLALLTPT